MTTNGMNIETEIRQARAAVQDAQLFLDHANETAREANDRAHEAEKAASVARDHARKMADRVHARRQQLADAKLHLDRLTA